MNRAGSYDYGTFAENERELARLVEQASVALDMEREIWKTAGLKKGLQVLDLACGPGVVTCEMARMIAPGKVLGLDINKQLLSLAQMQSRRESLSNVQFEPGDVYDLHLEEGTFDFVYARFLFQHLSHPERALANIVSVLKPGGTLCVVDVDDDMVLLYPEPMAFKAFTRAAADGQRRNGGDRHVGRKLVGYLDSAGLQDVRADIRMVTSFDIGLETFLKVTTLFKYEQIPMEMKVRARNWLKQINAIIQAPTAWGAAGVFVVTGRKKA